MHLLFWKWCESFTQHCNSHLNRIIIGTAIQDSIILTPRFVEVKKPSQVLASTLNIPYSFSGQLHWKQLEFNSPHPVPPITSMCPLSKSVIWSLGKHSPRGPWRRPAFFRWSIKLDQHLHYSRPWLFRCFKPLFIPIWGWTAFKTVYSAKTNVIGAVSLLSHWIKCPDWHAQI